MHTIVLFGVRGSGKDTVGHYLHNEHGFAPDSFAYPLKQMVKHAFPFTDEDLFGPSHLRERQLPTHPMGSDCLKCGKKLARNATAQEEPPIGKELICYGCAMTYPKNINARIALQTLGTEWGRRLYQDVWIDAAFERVRRNTSNDSFKFSTDPDMPDTISKGRSRFVITDGRYPNEQARSAELGAKTVLLLRKLDESTDTHTSESSLKTIPRERFQYVLDNRGSLEELPALVDIMVKALGFDR